MSVRTSINSLHNCWFIPLCKTNIVGYLPTRRHGVEGRRVLTRLKVCFRLFYLWRYIRRLVREPPVTSSCPQQVVQFTKQKVVQLELARKKRNDMVNCTMTIIGVVSGWCGWCVDCGEWVVWVVCGLWWEHSKFGVVYICCRCESLQLFHEESFLPPIY